MNTLLSRPPKVEIDFTDAQLTGFGGWSVLGQMEERLGLPRALSDLDALREDRVGQRLLGLGHVPSGRRLGEYLARMDEGQVETLLEVARFLTGQVAPAVVARPCAFRISPPFPMR